MHVSRPKIGNNAFILALSYRSHKIMSFKILFNDFVILALKTDQKEKAQVISKDVIIDDKLTININVQKELGSELTENF